MALYYLQQYISKTLNTTGGIDASQTADIELPDVTGIDYTKPGIACISYTDPLDTDSAEWITYTSINNTTKKFVGVTRGTEGYSAKAHAKGVIVAFPLSESHINNLNDQFETAGSGFKQITTPSNPDSGRNKLYFKSDDKLYKKTSSGTEEEVGSASNGWSSYSAVIPTRTTSDDPTYVLTFAGVDLTSDIGVGMRVKWTQNATVRYAIVTAIAFSTDTTLTLYGGTDYDVDDTATYAITDFNYSYVKAPLGFPLDITKWSVKLTDTSNRTQASPTASQWYNLGSFSINVPIGLWNVKYEVVLRIEHGTPGTYSGGTTLSKVNNTEDDLEFSTYLSNGDSLTQFSLTTGKEKILDLSTKDTYYLNSKINQSGFGNLSNRGDIGSTIIQAVCAYL